MKTQIVTNPIEVDQRLHKFGWSRESLFEVVERMVGAKNDCTTNHPLGASGYMAWAEGTARLRSVGAQMKGWENNDDDQIPSIHSAERRMKIAVCNTDDGTGMENRQPQNYNKKGASFDRAVGMNQEVFGTLLVESLEASMKVVAMPGNLTGTQLWYLCVYSEDRSVRAELSLPLECQGGFFKSFRERLILLGGDDDGGVRRRQAPDIDIGFEILVNRKQA